MALVCSFVEFALSGKPHGPMKPFPAAHSYLRHPTSRSDSTKMFGIEKQDARSTKCYFTHAALGEHVDDKHPPTKKKPFATVISQPFSHTVRGCTHRLHVISIEQFADFETG